MNTSNLNGTVTTTLKTGSLSKLDQKFLIAAGGIIGYTFIMKGCQRADNAYVQPVVAKINPTLGKGYKKLSNVAYGLTYKIMGTLMLASFGAYAYDTCKEYKASIDKRVETSTQE